MTCGKDFFFLGEHTKSQQANSIADYLPDDETFEAKFVPETNTRSMLEVFALQLKSLEEVINIFTNETSPECAVQLIEEWERMVGIPDSCFDIDDDITIRQRNVLIKLAKMNVQTQDDFKLLADAFGILASVQSGIDAGIAPDSVARFTIVITFSSNDIATFPLTFPILFGTQEIALLECIFAKVRPANCNVIFEETTLNLEFYLAKYIEAGSYWSLDETSGKTYSNSGTSSNKLFSDSDASTFDIAGSTSFTSLAPQAKDISTASANALVPELGEAATGVILSSGDTLIFIMKRQVDPQVDTVVMSYVSNVDNGLRQYSIVAGSEINITVLEGDASTETTYTLIPDTNFMLDGWNYVAITFNAPNNIVTYVNGIKRSTFSFPSIITGPTSGTGGVAGLFRVGGTFSPVTTSTDVQMDDICIAGGILAESVLTTSYHVWNSGELLTTEVSVGESSAANAIASQYSTHQNNAGLSTRTVITSGDFIAYFLEFGVDTGSEITIEEGTGLNLYIYGGPGGGPYTLQQTELNINSTTNNFFTYTFTTAEVFYVFEAISNSQPIQFSTDSV